MIIREDAVKFTDQMGVEIHLPRPPEHIICLVPSLTELLYDLGLEQEVVGITRYCPQPEDKHWRPVVIGGTKDFNFDQIDALSPDLIIGSREENYLEGISRLRERYQAWLSDVITLKDALNMITDIGSIVDKNTIADKLVREIASEFSQLTDYPPLRIAYLIWKDPFMVAAGGTFIDEILKHGGFLNIFQLSDRYPVIDPADLTAAEVILLSSEPYAFTENDVMEIRIANPQSKVLHVDGKIFTWYGSHLRKTPAYLRQLRAALE